MILFQNGLNSSYVGIERRYSRQENHVLTCRRDLAHVTSAREDGRLERRWLARRLGTEVSIAPWVNHSVTLQLEHP